MRAALVVLMRAALVVGWCAGCGASSDPGLIAALRVAGAQFVAGAQPADGAGPSVIALSEARASFVPGAEDVPLFGTLSASATAALIGLDGDRGYFIVTAGVPDTETPTLPSLRALLSVSPAATPGPGQISVRAVDAGGVPGAARVLPIVVEDSAPPVARLVVTLRWSGPADLDLHVVDPDGAEVWAKSPAAGAGALDLDSNAGCAEDGYDRENAVFGDAAPAGRYLVRVDAFSLCGAAAGYWSVEARASGQLIAGASGVAVDADTIGPHQRGSGRTALAIDLP